MLSAISNCFSSCLPRRTPVQSTTIQAPEITEKYEDKKNVSNQNYQIQVLSLDSLSASQAFQLFLALESSNTYTTYTFQNDESVIAIDLLRYAVESDPGKAAYKNELEKRTQGAIATIHPNTISESA